LKKELETNFQLKKALIEKVEILKQRTDWKDATKEVIEIQNEWKKIGPVSRKYTDALWKEFIAGCDHFFKQKNMVSGSQKSVEQSNLAAKQLLIDKIKTIDEKLSGNEALIALRLLIAEWNTIGHVPFKDKDKLYKNFREAVDKQYDRLNVAQVDRRIQQYRTTLTEMSGGGQNKGKLHNEREKLMRMYEKLKQELQTYENNVGFFNVSSKGGGAMLKEMENRIERLKNEMELIVKKIDTIDENLE
jgi:paraquat-inducible protein B